MRLVCRNKEQLERMVLPKILEALQQYPERGVIVEVSENQPPRTRRQQNKLHAMAGEMGAFSGEAKFKEEVLKQLSIWPRADVWVTRPDENDRTKKIKMSLPVSETRLTKAQESLIIDWMYAEAATWPGFEWSQ